MRPNQKFGIDWKKTENTVRVRSTQVFASTDEMTPIGTATTTATRIERALSRRLFGRRSSTIVKAPVLVKRSESPKSPCTALVTKSPYWRQIGSLNPILSRRSAANSADASAGSISVIGSPDSRSIANTAVRARKTTMRVYSRRLAMNPLMLNASWVYWMSELFKTREPEENLFIVPWAPVEFGIDAI